MQFLENVTRAFHEFGALLDQRVTTFGEGRVNRPGNGKDFPSLLVGEPGRDERTAFGRCFDNEAAEPEPADQSISRSPRLLCIPVRHFIQRPDSISAMTP